MDWMMRSLELRDVLREIANELKRFNDREEGKTSLPRDPHPK